MKKNISILLVLILSLSILTGCKAKKTIQVASNNTPSSVSEEIISDNTKADLLQEKFERNKQIEKQIVENTEENKIDSDTKNNETTQSSTNNNNSNTNSNNYSNQPQNNTPNNTPTIPNYSYGSYSLNESNLNNNRIGWYFGRNTSFSRPNGAKSESFLRQYDSYYIGDNRKVIYLTFDEGQSPTYASQNLDTLKKHGIKAVFFVTKPFIDSHPDLVNRMINEGHVVGNHTVNHLNMNNLASGNEIVNFIKEIADTETAFKQATGRNISKVFRYPEGAFSERTLSFTKSMGYRSYFWSFAYKDWEENCNTREESLNWMKSYYHNGALYLLHGVNRGNSEALDEFITFMKSQGYSFDLATNI